MNHHKHSLKGGKVVNSDVFPYAPIQKDFQLPSIASVGFDPPPGGPAPEVLGRPAESPRAPHSRPLQKSFTNKSVLETPRSPDRSPDASQRSSPSHSVNYGSNRSTPQRLLPISKTNHTIPNILHLNTSDGLADTCPNISKKQAKKTSKTKSEKGPLVQRRTSIQRVGPKKVTKLNELPKQKQILPNISTFEQFLSGNLDNLPPQRSSLVRIFLSSTFSDFKIERNALVKVVYPEMKQFCTDLGLDFQVVDLRWGISQEATNDHSVEKLCLLEIEHCKRLSCGTNFVAMLGDRYGFRPVPPEIDAKEFEILRGIAGDLKLEGRVVMDTWYKRDDNADPPVYVLQTVDSQLPHFCDTDPELRSGDLTKWNKINKYLASVLRQCATEAVKRKLISAEQEHEYYYSVTEQELTEGILKSKDCNHSCLVFIRSFTGIEADLNKPETDVKRYIDVKDLSGSEIIDPDCKQLRDRIRQKVLPSQLPTSNIKEFKVPWKPKGVNPTEYSEHGAYIKKLLNAFKQEMKKQIKAVWDKKQQDLMKECSISNVLHNSVKVVKSTKQPKTEVKARGHAFPAFSNDPRIAADLMKGQIAIGEMIRGLKAAEVADDVMDQSRLDLHAEVLHHLHLCLDKCQVFCGRQKELALIQQLVKHSHLRQPIIIYGSSGSGKTAFCAIVTKKIRMWLGDQSIIIVRFLGTSPQSSTLRLMLISVCEQICAAYKIIPDRKKLRDLNKVTKYLQELMMHVSVMFGTTLPLIIILDSLDQLSPTGGAHNLSWIPVDIPSGVHFMVSLKEEAETLLSRIKQIFPEKKSVFVQLGKMNENVILEYVGAYSAAQKRTFTEAQYEYLVQHLSQNPQPLMMKISMDQACLWHSYIRPEEMKLPSCVKDAVVALFEKYEKKFGKVFIMAALGYITASKDGISHIELEDALSCSDEVLSEVYEFHNPPVDGIIRIPPLLWARVKYDLQDYLVERMAQGKTTLFWYHRQFFDVASKRYVTNDNKHKLHSVLAEIFDAEQPIKRTIRLEKRKLTILDADRQVAPQPLTSKNVRKLTTLPYHLFQAQKFTALRDRCWCNLNFLMCYIEACSLHELLAALAEVLEERNDDNIEIIYNSLRCSSVTFTDNLQVFPVQLLASLLKFVPTHQSIRTMCGQCADAIRARSKLTLLPTLGSIQASPKMMKWYKNGVSDVAGISKDSSQLVLVYKGLERPLYQLFNADRLEVGHFLQSPNHAEGRAVIRCLISATTQKIYMLYHDHVLVFNAHSGEKVTRFTIESKQSGHLNHDIALSPDDQYIVLGGKDRLALYEIVKTPNNTSYKLRAGMTLGSSLATTNILFSHDINQTISSHTIKGKKNTFGAVVLWNFWDKQLKSRVGLPSPVVTRFLYHLQPLANHDLVICGCDNGHVFLIDVCLGQVVIEAGNPLFISSPQSTILTSFSSTFGMLLTAIRGQASVQLWNADVTCMKQLTALTVTTAVTAVCLVSDGKTMIIGGSDGNILLYSVAEDPVLLKSLQAHDEALCNIICEYLDQVITVSLDCTLKVWDLMLDSQPSCSLKNVSPKDNQILENEDVTCCCVTSDGRHIITGSKHNVKVWKYTDSHYRFQKSLLVGDISKLGLSEGDRVLVVLSSKKLLLLNWALDCSEALEIEALNEVKEVHDVCVSKNIVTMTSFIDEGKSSVFTIDLDTNSLKEKCLVVGKIPLAASIITFLQVKKLLVLRIPLSGSSTKELEYHVMSINTETGQVVTCSSSKTNLKLAKAVFSHCCLNDSSLYLGCHGDVVLWQPEDAQWQAVPSQKKNWLNHYNCVYGFSSEADTKMSDKVKVTMVVCSTDNDVIVTGEEYGSLVLWSKDESFKLKGHFGMITAGALSTKNKCLVTGSRDHTIQMWDLESKKVLCVVSIHMIVDSIEFCQDESMILVKASEGAVSKVFAFDVAGGATKARFFVTE